MTADNKAPMSDNDLVDQDIGASKNSQGYNNSFLRKLQYLLAIPAFPFIVVCLGYMAIFALFIFWRIS